MKLIVAGDFYPNKRVTDYLINTCSDGAINPQLSRVLHDSDYSLVNVECAITGDDALPIKKVGPTLKASPEVTKVLKNCGFNAVTLANNHVLDYGAKGLSDTIDSFSKLGIDYVGAGLSYQEAVKPLIKTINGETIAIINCCEHEFSVTHREYAPTSCPLDVCLIYDLIQKIKTQVNYILVIIHGGHEHWQLPSTRMKGLYHLFVDFGANAVVNHHQHCYSGYEIYKGCPIIYGLGNFLFDNGSETISKWNQGYLAELTFTSKMNRMQIYPYVQCVQSELFNFLKQDAFDEMLDRINSIIHDRELLMAEEEKYYKETSDWYTDFIRPSGNRLLLALKNRKLLPRWYSEKWLLRVYSVIHCESHRDKLLFKLFNSLYK